MDASGECVHVCVCDNVYKWCMRWFSVYVHMYLYCKTNKPTKKIHIRTVSIIHYRLTCGSYTSKQAQAQLQLYKLYLLLEKALILLS